MSTVKMPLSLYKIESDGVVFIGATGLSVEEEKARFIADKLVWDRKKLRPPMYRVLQGAFTVELLEVVSNATRWERGQYYIDLYKQQGLQVISADRPNLPQSLKRPDLVNRYLRVRAENSCSDQASQAPPQPLASAPETSPSVDSPEERS